VTEAFMTALGPSQIDALRVNEYYPTHDDFLDAIADAMNVEYRAIVDAGFVLQVDEPRISTYYITRPDLTLAEVQTWMARRVELLNRSLQGIPRDRVRLHACYSIDIGPRVHDMDLADMVDLLLQVEVGGFSFEASNPRHEHEYHVWERTQLPDGMVLVPGVISHTTPVVEHPELVAERIVRFARIVGRENVIASADCGFAATTRDEPDIHPTIAWAKLEALARGAEIASRQLWDR
jgi:5-methyltetrahydropteroyltriglutamate--homocysteine methyltransferase